MRILNHKFLYFFILLGLSVCLSSCSDDDEPQTFLEKYDGTKWTTIGNIPKPDYFRIKNNKSKFMDQWYYTITNDCFIYYDNSILPGSFEITENSGDTFIIKTTEIEFPKTYTFTIQGEYLNILYQKEGDSDLTTLLKKTTEDVDNLPICD